MENPNSDACPSDLFVQCKEEVKDLFGLIVNKTPIIDFFKNISGVKTLKTLREVSSTLNDALSQVYFNKVGKSPCLRRGVPGTYRWELSRAVPEGGAYIFRKLHFSDIYNFGAKSRVSNDGQLLEILKLIGPYLQEIEIGHDLSETNARRDLVHYFSILQQLARAVPLSNLTDLKITLLSSPIEPLVDYIPKLRRLFQDLGKRVHVKMYVNWTFMELFSKSYHSGILFPSNRVQIEVCYHRYGLELELKKILDHYTNRAWWYYYNHIFFKPEFFIEPKENGFDFTNNGPRILETFEGIMSTFRDKQKWFLKLDLSKLDYIAEQKGFNLFGSSLKINIWGQNITKLFLSNYYNLVCIEFFPNLIDFTLQWCDVNSCILSNDASKDQEILTKRFEGKTLLEVIIIVYFADDDSRIKPSNALAKIIRKFVKKLQLKVFDGTFEDPWEIEEEDPESEDEEMEEGDDKNQDEEIEG